MIDLTVKTLDSRNHAFSVPDDTTVRQLKAKIEETMSIGIDSQRLIYCGRVLQDDKKLAECDVNGKVIHLVQRAPPSVSRPAGTGSGPTNRSRRGPRYPSNANALYLGTIAIPWDSHGLMGSGLLEGQGRNNAAMIMSTAERMLDRAAELLNRLENPTSNEYHTEDSTSSRSAQDSNANVASQMEEGAPDATTTATIIATTLTDPESAPSITLSSVNMPGEGMTPGSGHTTSTTYNPMMEVRLIEAAARVAATARAAATGAAAAAATAAARAASADASVAAARAATAAADAASTAAARAATAAAAASAATAAADAAAQQGIAPPAPPPLSEVLSRSEPSLRAAFSNAMPMGDEADRRNSFSEAPNTNAAVFSLESFFEGMRAGAARNNRGADGAAAAARAEAFVSGMRAARTATNGASMRLNGANAPAGNTTGANTPGDNTPGGNAAAGNESSDVAGIFIGLRDALTAAVNVMSAPSVRADGRGNAHNAGAAAPNEDRPGSDETYGRQNGNRGASSSSPQQQGAQALAAILEKLNRINARFQPFLERYHQLLRDDPAVTNDPALRRELRALASGVPELMHLLSHAYHGISDLKLNIDAPPPRNMRTVSTSVVHTSIPLLEQINITTERPAGSRFRTDNNSNAAGNGRSGSAANGTTSASEAATTAPTAPTAGDGSGRPPNQTGAGADPSWSNNPRMQTSTPDLRSMFDINMPSNLEFFVEVGPSGLTVNSVDPSGSPNANPPPSSNNGTTGASGDENGGNFPWNLPLPSPPEFIQNLITAVAGHMMGARPPTAVFRTSSTGTSTSGMNTASSNAPAASTGAGRGVQTGQTGGQNSQARGNTATQPTTATQTRSTARPHVHFAAPIPELVLSTGNNDFDPFLPCNSHHVIPYARRSHLQGGVSGGPARPAGANSIATNAAPTAEAPNAGAQAAGTPTPTAPPNPVDQTLLDAAVRAAISSAIAEEERDTSEATSDATSEEALLRGTANLLQLSPNIANTSVHNFVNDMVNAQNLSGTGLELLTLILDPVSGGHGAPLPEALLREISQVNVLDSADDEVEGQSLFADLRLAVIRTVTMSDLMAMMVGNWSTLNHARAELNEFVRIRVLDNQPPTDENVERATTAFLQELRPHMDVLLEARLRDDVDIVATITRFHEAIIPEFIRFITNEENEANFGADLYNLMRRYFVDLCSIIIRSSVSCTEGENALRTILLALLRRMIGNNLPTVVNWIGNTIIERLPSAVHSYEPFRQYVVHRAPASSSVSTPSAKPEPMDTDPSSPTEPQPLAPTAPTKESPAHEFSAASSLLATTSAVPPTPTPVPLSLTPTPAPTPASTSSASPILISSVNRLSQEAGAIKTAQEESSTLVPMETDSAAPEVIRPEPWHGALPPEWVPIITRDGQRQRRAQHTPLSDAYLSGMPPKRRKLVTDSKPQGTLNQVITASVQQAIQAAGVSQAGVSLVQEAAANDLTFQEAYRDQLRATVRANLANNPDFSAERYPNAARYFCQ